MSCISGYPLAEANGKGYRPDQSILVFKALFFAVCFS